MKERKKANHQRGCWEANLWTLWWNVESLSAGNIGLFACNQASGLPFDRIFRSCVDTCDSHAICTSMHGATNDDDDEQKIGLKISFSYAERKNLHRVTFYCSRAVQKTTAATTTKKLGCVSSFISWFWLLARCNKYSSKSRPKIYLASQNGFDQKPIIDVPISRVHNVYTTNGHQPASLPLLLQHGSMCVPRVVNIYRKSNDIKAINHIESNLGFTLEEITYLLRQHPSNTRSHCLCSASFSPG